MSEVGAVDFRDDAFYGALLEDDPHDLYDNAPCAYLSTLPDGTIIKANRTFFTWSGHEPRSLVGQRTFQGLLAPGDRIFHETHVAPALRLQGQVREIAVDLVTATGARLPVILNGVLKRDDDGEPTVIRIALFDATERRSYERELVAARQRAEASDARATALARTLQASFLPTKIPDVPGLDIAGAYRPAGDGSEVGGDFYDVFRCGDTSWGVIIGDVCGKGAAAASLTLLARHTTRAVAQHTSSPAAVLTELHKAFVELHPEQFCTAVLLLLDIGSHPVRASISAGGHQLPLRRRAHGDVESVGRAGAIVGLLPAADLSDSVVELALGDTLVLCTDGVTEARRDRADFFGEERLRSLVGTTKSSTARQLADEIVEAAVDFQAGLPRDDIAAVVIRCTPS